MTGVPKSWVECRLSDIAEVNPSLDRCPYPQDGTVHFVPMGAVEAESGHIDVSTQRPYSEVRKGYTAFVPGDVLFAKITPCMENGKMAVVPDLPNLVGCGSTEFHVLRAMDDISPDYIYYYVSSKSFRFEAEHKMTGAVGQKRVPASFVAEHTFPLPPLPEQHRIVARIEELFSELDASVESLTKARELLGLYRQSLLKAAFQGELTADWRAANPDKLPPPETLLSLIREDRETRYAKALDDWQTALSEWRNKGEKGRKPQKPDRPEPIESLDHAVLSKLPTLPHGWSYVRLAVLGDLARGKSRHRPRNDPKLFGGAYPFIQTGEVKAAGKRITEYSATYSEFGLEQSRLWPTGTLCITIAANIAETAFLGFDACFPDSVVGFTALDTVVQADFVELFIKAAKVEISAYAPATAQKNINLTTLEELVVPYCGLEEQQVLFEKLDAVFSELDVTELEIISALTRIAALRQSILKRAFSGTLVPQDPSDEPASTLLARLKSQSTAAVRGRRKRS